MEDGHVCAECGDELRYLSKEELWHCDNCRQSNNQKNLQKSTSLPLKTQSTKAIWILVIVVLSVVILTFIAAAAVYIMVGGIISSDSTPPGVLDFSESATEPGVYTGGFISLSKEVDLEDASLTITDDSLRESGSLDSLVDGGTIVISDGLRCSFTDANQNYELDTDDIFRIEGGGSGDIMHFVYIPTGGLIAHYTFI